MNGIITCLTVLLLVISGCVSEEGDTGNPSLSESADQPLAPTPTADPQPTPLPTAIGTPKPTAGPTPKPSATPSTTPTPTPKPSTVPTPAPTPVATPIPGGALPADVVFSGGDPMIAAAKGADKPVGSYMPTLYSAVAMRASRGETVGFLVKSRVSACDTIDVSWAGTAPSGVNISFFTMGTITTKLPSYTGAYVGTYLDATIPRPSGAFCPASGSGTQDVFHFIDVAVAKTATPGTFAADFKLRNSGKSFRLNFKIYKMVMPETQAMPAYMINDSWANMLQHYGGWNSNETNLQGLYLNSLAAHRISALNSTVGGALPVVTVNGQLQLDVNSYNFLTMNARNRPSNAGISIPMGNTDDYWRAAENTIKQYGWQGRAFIYMVDEPTDAEHPAVIAQAQHIKSLAPSLKIMVTEYAATALRPYVDIFVPVLEQVGSGFPDLADYAALRSQGKNTWWYVSCMSHGCSDSPGGGDSGSPDLVTDRTSSHVRSIGWINHKYGMQGFLYYFTNYQNYVANPWVDQWSKFGANDDGTLFYPGKAGTYGLTSDQPVPSIRMKLFRESSFDAEYLKMMSQLSAKPSWFDSGFNTVVPSKTSWTRTYRNYVDFRDRMGDYLDSITP